MSSIRAAKTEENWDEGLRRSARERLQEFGGKVAPFARSIDFPEDALRRFLSGEGLSADNFARLRRALPGETYPSVMRETAASYGAGDPVMELVRAGQAEQAAWVLEFAAKILEAGAQRLRVGMATFAVEQDVQAAVAAANKPATPTAPADAPKVAEKKRSSR